MGANAMVKGEVNYRAGDGPMIRIPEGPVEVELADDSAVLSWGDAGNTQSTALPIAEYERYVRDGLIALNT
ncbi:hypothetical protein H6CHR_02127 [Variovorax sp. PBL-H6]|uniref:hypothetical protein n=1 Tax=Variovorax sp. PBL-H6 TaxID=434009 RepID=UPI0013167C8C|nr:hypothetical protein [Variovorax sp. PBL-H6]VTU24114.1 hypothetical protein H6CHR_02127 [Variovorax sp. PBL-H6]